MKVTKPAETVEVCDICGQRDHLKDCDVCGRQFCLSHEGIVGQCWGFTCLCCECVEHESVQKICKRYADLLTPIFEERRATLVRLGKRIRCIN